MLFMLLFSPLQASAASKAGRVTFQSGEAWVLKAGKTTPLHKGDIVLPRDILVTGNRGRIKLKMVDNTVVYVGSKSRIKIKAYQMSSKYLSKGLFNMLWGKARFLVNKLRKKGSSFSVASHTAVLGVRGTEFSVEVPRPSNLTQAKALQAKPSVVLPKKPVTMMLFEGAVVGKNVYGGEKLIKPGILAQFKSNGKILTRAILPKDVKRLGIQPLKRPNVNLDAPAKPQMTPLRAAQPKQGKELKARQPESQSTTLPKAGAAKGGAVGVKPSQVPSIASGGVQPSGSEKPSGVRKPSSAKPNGVRKPKGTKPSGIKGSGVSNPGRAPSTVKPNGVRKPKGTKPSSIKPSGISVPTRVPSTVKPISVPKSRAPKAPKTSVPTKAPSIVKPISVSKPRGIKPPKTSVPAKAPKPVRRP
jgi:hypothetical protein